MFPMLAASPTLRAQTLIWRKANSEGARMSVILLIYLIISVSPSNPASDGNIFVFHNFKKSVFKALIKAS